MTNNNQLRLIVNPVPAYVACGLKSEKELSTLPLQEIWFRIKSYYQSHWIIEPPKY